MMRSAGSSNCKDARIDVGVVLEPVEGKDGVFSDLGTSSSIFGRGYLSNI